MSISSNNSHHHRRRRRPAVSPPPRYDATSRAAGHASGQPPSSSHESQALSQSTPQTPPPHPAASTAVPAYNSHILGLVDGTEGQRWTHEPEEDASLITRTTRSHANTGPASGFSGLASVFPSVRAVSDDRMSVNPAREVQDTLRSRDSTFSASLASSATSYSIAHDVPSRRSSARETASPRAYVQPLMAANMEGALPENDGMQPLRQQLQEIKQLALSTEEKAKRMHFLMTQDYLKHRVSLEPSPESSPDSRGIGGDIQASPLLGAAAIPIDPKNPYNLRPGDLEPVFSPLPRAPKDIDADLDEAMDDDGPELGCMHYKRNVKVQCFDCQRWFPCRHCHDHSNDLPFAHSLNRKKTQNMLCMLCQTPQPAADICVNCGQYSAWYYCPKCKLWDNDSNKRIYHCDDCGICRVGEGLGKDYVHCRRCNVCISISTSAAHPCIERATEGNCPLCLVPLFESKTPVVSLPCGHYMHGDCYKDLMAVTYKCPVCSKSAVNMELQWRKLDDEIRAQPMPDGEEDLEGLMPHIEDRPAGPDVAPAEGAAEMPEPHQRRPREVWVGCNDCGGRSWTPFHWLGLKCQRCDSYNTSQMAPTAVHETETERLMRQQQVHRHDFTGNAVLRDAGIGVEEAGEFANSALEVPESPAQQATLSSSPRNASGAQSPGRYFVHDEEPRRPSFTNFSAPSMPNIPTLSNLADMPRMPRMPNLPNLPNLQNMRQNLPNMPNVELPRFSPYEMINAFSRTLSPMRYYLEGLDAREADGVLAPRVRPTSVQSDPATRRPLPSKLGTSSTGSAPDESLDLFASDDEGVPGGEEDDSDSVHAVGVMDEETSEEESEATDGEGDVEMEMDDEGDFDLLGHR